MVVWPRTIFISSILSLILHVLVVVLLILSFNFTPQPISQTKPDVNIVQAVAVDKRQVELELEKIKKAQQEKHAKQEKEQKRFAELIEKNKQLEQVRKAEEKKLAETAQKKQQQLKKEQVQRAKVEKEAQALEKAGIEAALKLQETLQKNKQEEERLSVLANEAEKLEEKRKAEEEKIRQAQVQAKKLAAEDDARKKQAIEDERKQKEDADSKLREQELVKELANEEAAEQLAQDQRLINSIESAISKSIEQNFNIAGLPEGLKCKLLIRLIPGGQVIDVEIIESSGNELFDSRAINATEKASPLPIPEDVVDFERLDLREITMTFSPTN